MLTYKFEINGAVQGVGFRPFIFLVANKFGIKGEVYNDSQGVKIVGNFINDLEANKFLTYIKNNLPPLARIDEIKTYRIKDCIFDEFLIIKSKQSIKFNPILPDFPLCKECKKEFYDSKNHRFLYPFINCTNCGPRFSIINELPYDRQNTTMSKFQMCSFCESEYTSPLNRRFHAQPISCPDCGPKLFAVDSLKNNICYGLDAAEFIANKIKDGNIVAVKGLGGFHLVCDATNFEVLERLRSLKNRPFKPFAVMCKDINMACNIANLDKYQKELLDGIEMPIVICNSKDKLAKNVAPNLNKIGIFLANTGVHLLLFEYLDCPVVATSANISSEPILYRFEDLYNKLGHIIDYYLCNDRDIVNPSDDSIAMIFNNKPFYLRSSRGVSPQIFKSIFDVKGTFLALGAELKNEFAIYKDGQIFRSPYIGDLKNIATFDRFLNIIDMFCNTYDFKFDAVIGDMHPYFLNTKYFQKQNYKIFKVQHHYAHLLSNLYENNLLNSGKKFLGFCFDGTGYGCDGNIWGGEVMIFDENEFKRVCHFDEFKLIGGDNSIKNIELIALSILKKYGIKDDEFIFKFNPIRIKNFDKVYEKTNLKTSSLGRIFDAFGVYALGFNSTYEGEIGMRIESIYDKNIEQYYDFNIKDGVIDYKQIFIQSKYDTPTQKASKFLNTIAQIIIEISNMYELDIVLSGGVFQNITLLNILKSKINKHFYLHNNIPTNDSSIAIGQLVSFIYSNNLK